MIIFGFLPVIAFFSLYRYFTTQQKDIGPGRRVAFLKAAIIWGFLVVVVTELLSYVYAINVVSLAVYWSAVAIFFFILSLTSKTGWFPLIKTLLGLTLFEKYVCFFIGFFTLLTFIVAALACPNSWDANIYHLSRVAFWKQNHSVAHYPTPDYRQLFLPPWVEYAELQFQVLTNSDYFACLTSWFAYGGNALVVSLLGALWGANRVQQLLMALAVLTIPTAITEASGVRGDIILSFWSVVFVTMLVWSLRKAELGNILLTGIALGLGVLSKGTMYLLALPLLLWFLFEAIHQFNWKKALIAVLIIVVAALAVNSAFYWRNYKQLGCIITQRDEQYVVTHQMTLPLVFSNVIKNVFSQLGTPIHGINRSIEGLVNQLHQWLHIDPLDPRADYQGNVFKVYVGTYEEQVTNCLQVLLIIIGGIGLLVMGLKEKRFELCRLLFALGVAFVYISSSILWSVNLTRFLLSVMVIALPLVFLWIARQRRPRWILWILVTMLVVFSSKI